MTLDNISIGNALSVNRGEKTTRVDDHAIPTEFINIKGNEIDPRPKWNSGWRVRLIYEFPTKWVVEAAFGAIKGSANNHVVADEITLNTSTFPIFNALMGNPLKSLDTHWSLDYFAFGANVGKIYEPLKGVLFVPYIGFGGLISKEDYPYRGILLTTTNIPPLDDAASASIHGVLNARSEGYGIDAGTWLYWNLFSHFSLWGRIGGTALYTILHTRGTLDIDEMNAEDTLRGVENINVVAKTITATPTLHGLIGLLFNYPYRNMIFSARVAWEQHIQVSPGRNAPVQGISVGGAIAF